jgi:hypothetical protein
VELGRAAGGRTLREVRAPGGEAPEELPLAVQYGVWLSARRTGAEHDLVIDAGEGPVNVQLRWSPDGVVEVDWSRDPLLRPESPATLSLAAWGEELAARFGFGGFAGPLGWTEQEMGDIVLALTMLSDEERRALEGVVLLRDADSPRSKSELAYFEPTDPPSLWFFDRAFAHEDQAFVGPVAAPLPIGVMTALHEFGHLLADWPVRVAYQEWLEAWEIARDARGSVVGDAARAAADERKRAYRRIGRERAVIDAWEELRAGRRGPTSWAFRDPDESFAEAFALYHADPDALERALPGAVAWFDSGAPLIAAGLSDPATAQ